MIAGISHAQWRHVFALHASREGWQRATGASWRTDGVPRSVSCRGKCSTWGKSTTAKKLPGADASKFSKSLGANRIKRHFFRRVGRRPEKEHLMPIPPQRFAKLDEI